MKQCVFTTTCITALASFLAAAQADMTLVNNGKPAALIVTAENPTALATYAANELAAHISQMSGAQLPVLAETETAAKTPIPRIFVGDSVRSAELGLTTETLKPEEIVLRSDGTDLIVIGGDAESAHAPPSGREAVGTLYAVYELLERELGVRWLWPGETGTFVPTRKTVILGALDRRYQPPLIQRHIRSGLRDWGDRVAALGLTAEQSARLKNEYALWAARRRLGRRANFKFGHAYNNWLEKYGHEHPDWFAMMPDGTRVTPEKPYPSLERAKLCITNPELIDFIAQQGKAYLEANPGSLSFSACPNDSRGYCMCPKCKALDPPEGLPTEMNYPGGRFMYPSLSDRYVWFWNQIAQRLGNEFPGRYIGAYAYSNYNHPPLREKLSPRVIIGYVGFNYLNAKYTAQSRKDWAGWAETGCKLYLRPNLLLLGHGFPLNYAREFGNDLKTCFKTGMLGTDFDSMTHQYAAQAPIFYVLTALLWDPERDVENIITEFLQAAYGPAAPRMRAYWDRLETLTQEIATHQEADGGHDTVPSFHDMIPQFYAPETVAELRSLTGSAAKAAGDNKQCLQRIRVAETALDYAEIQRDVLVQVRQYVADGSNIDDLAEALTRKQTFFSNHLDDWTIGLHHIYWREARSSRHRRMYGGDLVNELSHPHKLAMLPKWRFRTDPEDVGEAQQWYAVTHDDSDWANVTCFSFWERQGFKDYDGVAWYRTTLNVPAEWRQRGRLVLRFGAVDESFRLYIDGKQVHESVFDAGVDPDLWKKPRPVDVNDLFTPGNHTIAVRVHDSAGAGGLWKPVMLIYE
jgi:hypothetical protein